MNIEKASLKDVKEITSLNDNYFHEEGRNWEKLVSSKDSEMFVLKIAGKIIGFTGLKYQEWNNTIKVIDIFVHPNYRSKGYGKELINFLISYLKKKKEYRTLIVEAPSLNPVLILYLKNGFRICGFNDRYYSNKSKEIAIFLSYDFN